MTVNVVYSGSKCEITKTNRGGLGCSILLRGIPNRGYEFNDLLVTIMKRIEVGRISGFRLTLDWEEVSRHDVPGLEGSGFKTRVQQELKKYKDQSH